MFVLSSNKYGPHRTHWDGYHTGGFLTYKGEVYSIAHRDISKAKKYTSRKRAENACEAINNKIVNYEYTVVELEDK